MLGQVLRCKNTLRAVSEHEAWSQQTEHTWIGVVGLLQWQTRAGCARRCTLCAGHICSEACIFIIIIASQSDNCQQSLVTQVTPEGHTNQLATGPDHSVSPTDSRFHLVPTQHKYLARMVWQWLSLPTLVLMHTYGTPTFLAWVACCGGLAGACQASVTAASTHQPPDSCCHSCTMCGVLDPAGSSAANKTH